MKKTPAPQPIIDEVDGDSDLPEGWATCIVSDVFRSFGGGTPNKGTSAYWGGPIPWLSSGDIKTDRIQSASECITKAGLANSSANLCRAGSVVVVVRSGILKHTLPVAVIEREMAINQDIKCFDSRDDEFNAWLALALRSSANGILALNREGTTVQSVKYETLRNFDVLIPPLAERRRIISSVNQLSTQVGASADRLAKVRKILKAFRQSVLAAACFGRLTEDWREKHPNNESVPATIQAIRSRREQEVKSVSQREKLEQIYGVTEENDSNDLPEVWRFVTLNKLCSSFDYGTSAKSQPKGNVPVLRMGNIQGGEIDWSDLVYTSDGEEIRQYSLRPNTVLFNRTNSQELVGKTAIYRGDRPAIFAGYLIRITHLRELDPQYLNLCLNTNYARDFYARVRTDGVNQSNINAQKLGTFEVPFCSLPEQHEIVRRVEALFKLADAIEKRVEAATKRADKLTQAILAKAFRGELVPTEAGLARKEGRTYEPASELLARIRAERDKSATTKPAGATRKSRVVISGKR